MSGGGGGGGTIKTDPTNPVFDAPQHSVPSGIGGGNFRDAIAALLYGGMLGGGGGGSSVVGTPHQVPFAAGPDQLARLFSRFNNGPTAPPPPPWGPSTIAAQQLAHGSEVAPIQPSPQPAPGGVPGAPGAPPMHDDPRRNLLVERSRNPYLALRARGLQ